MNESARPARVEDVDVVAALAAEARAELTSTKGGAVWARREGARFPDRSGLVDAIEADDQLVVVGTVDDTAVGYALVAVERQEDGGALARLSDIFVLPGCRGVGVGEELIELVLDWARDRGCFGVDSLALPGNRATKNFFETHGLVARAIVVHRALT